jgi:hypothetical protein
MVIERRSNFIAGTALAVVSLLVIGSWIASRPSSVPIDQSPLPTRTDRALPEESIRQEGSVSTPLNGNAPKGEIFADSSSYDASDQSKFAGRIWSDEPAIVERKIYDWLAQMGDWEISGINSVSCTSTRCDIRFSGTGDYFDHLFSRGLFFAIFPQVIGTRRHEVAPGVFEYSIAAHSYHDKDAPFVLSESQLRHLITAPISENDHDRPATPLGQYEGVDLVLETFCAGTCPLETRRVVRFDVQDSANCEAIGGAVQFMVVPAEAGYRDDLFCIQSFWFKSSGREHLAALRHSTSGHSRVAGHPRITRKQTRAAVEF